MNNTLQSKGSPRRMAPWQDSRGTVIREGDRVRSGAGAEGIVVYLEGADVPWRIRYDHDPEYLANLSVQICLRDLTVMVTV